MRPSRPTNILVADDDGIMRDLMRDLLTQAGYRVRLAMSGDDAIAHCTRHGPSFDGTSFSPAALALLDMDMPHGDGITTCRSLRRLPGWQHVPIIMVTSHGTDLAVRDALDAGIDGFVVKPFSTHDLLQRISAWIGGHIRQVPPAALSAASAGPLPRNGALRADAFQKEVLQKEVVQTDGAVQGIAWSVGAYSLPSHERGQPRDVGRLLRARAGPAPSRAR